jgi:hypothetical protein
VDLKLKCLLLCLDQKYYRIEQIHDQRMKITLRLI